MITNVVHHHWIHSSEFQYILQATVTVYCGAAQSDRDHIPQSFSPLRSLPRDKQSTACDCYSKSVKKTIRGWATYFGSKGITLRSTTRRFLIPRTRKSVSTQAPQSSLLPIRTVLHVCHELKRLPEQWSYLSSANGPLILMSKPYPNILV